MHRRHHARTSTPLARAIFLQRVSATPTRSIRIRSLAISLVVGLLIIVFLSSSALYSLAEDSVNQPGIYAKSNLAAWCIVPFDGKNRTPRERAAMLEQLGFAKFAYDWRDQHIASLPEEIAECQRRGIEFFAFWGWHDALEPLIKQYDVHPQIWLTAPSPDGATPSDNIENAVESLLPMVEKTKRLGLKLGLYNHGEWGGEPENLAAVCRLLRERHGADHVGIVYNFHHGHGHIDDFEKSLNAMLPYLLCVNLNGMNENEQPKILAIGAGQHERQMMMTLKQSGYVGPIGVIHHRDGVDAETGLNENLIGLQQTLRDLGDEAALHTYNDGILDKEKR